jgi:hypothetical protein
MAGSLLCGNLSAQSVYFQISAAPICQGKPATIWVNFASLINNDFPETYYIFRNGGGYGEIFTNEYYFGHPLGILNQGDQIRFEVVTEIGNRYIS